MGVVMMVMSLTVGAVAITAAPRGALVAAARATFGVFAGLFAAGVGASAARGEAGA